MSLFLYRRFWNILLLNVWKKPNWLHFDKKRYGKPPAEWNPVSSYTVQEPRRTRRVHHDHAGGTSGVSHNVATCGYAPRCVGTYKRGTGAGVIVKEPGSGCRVISGLPLRPPVRPPCVRYTATLIKYTRTSSQWSQRLYRAYLLTYRKLQ